MQENYRQTGTDIFTDEPVVYGSFMQRAGAAIIDSIILGIPVLLLIQFTYKQEIYIISAIVIDWLYYALQESGSMQATLGKKALGLKVTSLDGQRISFGQATGRYFGKIISRLIIYIGYLMVLWDDKRQALHDKMAGTLVVTNR